MSKLSTTYSFKSCLRRCNIYNLKVYSLCFSFLFYSAFFHSSSSSTQYYLSLLLWLSKPYLISPTISLSPSILSLFSFFFLSLILSLILPYVFSPFSISFSLFFLSPHIHTLISLLCFTFHIRVYVLSFPPILFFFFLAIYSIILIFFPCFIAFLLSPLYLIMFLLLYHSSFLFFVYMNLSLFSLTLKPNITTNRPTHKIYTLLKVIIMNCIIEVNK